VTCPPRADAAGVAILRRFPPGRTWPNEEFIQWAIEQHFGRFSVQAGTKNRGPDLKCTDTGTLVWWIEVKGLTSSPYLDLLESSVS
jgi:hypothetical protein